MQMILSFLKKNICLHLVAAPLPVALHVKLTGKAALSHPAHFAFPCSSNCVYFKHILKSLSRCFSIKKQSLYLS